MTDIYLERRKALAAALHQPMPKGFEWDFSTIESKLDTGCGTVGCALGLAMHIWPESRDEIYNEGEEFFGMSAEDFDDIFYNALTYGKHFINVTPDMVAEKLESLE